MLLSMEGVYPTIALGLPRVQDELYISCLEQAQAAAAVRKAAETSKAPVPPSPPHSSSPVPPLGRPSPSKALAGGSRPSTSASVKPPPSAQHRASASLKNPGPDPAAKHPPERKPELEAERLRLVKLLVDKEASLRPAPALATVAIPDGRGGEDDLVLPDQRPAVTTASKPSQSLPPATTSAPKRDKAAIQPPIPSIFSANYVVDFGYVTKGTTRNRKVRMTNPGSQAVTLQFEKVRDARRPLFPDPLLPLPSCPC